ncbi:MAG: DUF1848 domain-containing protein [Candidatus Ozemobacteraceae bacterium]
MAAKKNVISVSRRTDIPAFYSQWFMNRIKAGFCAYPNTLYPHKYYRVSLLPKDVLGFVFWTRHAAPLLPHLAELDRLGFAYYFHYTVLGYPKAIDPRSPSLDVAISTFHALSKKIGGNKVFWRYDPIVLNMDINSAWHKENFLRIADALEGFTTRLVISIIDPYAKTQRRLGVAEDGVLYNPDSYIELLNWLVAEANKRGITVQSCAEASLQIPGITRGSCVDVNLLYSLADCNTPYKISLHNQRPGCLCRKSVDIGANNTCGFGCLYCYASANHTKALETLKKHNPEWSAIVADVQFEILSAPPIKWLPRA